MRRCVALHCIATRRCAMMCDRVGWDGRCLHVCSSPSACAPSPPSACKGRVQGLVLCAATGMEILGASCSSIVASTATTSADEPTKFMGVTPPPAAETMGSRGTSAKLGSEFLLRFMTEAPLGNSVPTALALALCCPLVDLPRRPELSPGLTSGACMLDLGPRALMPETTFAASPNHDPSRNAARRTAKSRKVRIKSRGARLFSLLFINEFRMMPLW